MRQAIETVAGLCLMAALCEQLLDGSRYFPAVRLALGLEIAWLAVSLLDQVRHVLN